MLDFFLKSVSNISLKPKTGKEDLKELQKSIQLLAATPDEGNFFKFFSMF